MNDPRIASINADTLYKGQTISADVVWEHFANRRPATVASWVMQHGDEELARVARMPQVLLTVRAWLDRDRKTAELPPLVMNTVGGVLNVLTDDKASSYLNDQAFQGLRRHQRASTRLVAAVDESKLTGAARREHQNRINVHSFIAASAQGAQRQLRLLRQNGKKAPKLEGN
jgi:hypothetical protein